MNLQLAKIYVFVNELFANNKDLNAQINFILVISTKSGDNTEFTLTRNIIYTSLIKCKRVTYTMLTSKLYIIIARVNMLITLSSTINIIINKLGIKQLLIIIYINFLLLYKYIIKLNITKNKYLIINIILIR